MTSKTDFRGTEAQDFMRCPKRYDYAWLQNLQPKQRNAKLAVGSAIHKFLEVLYKTKAPFSSLDQMEAYLEQECSGMDEVEYNDLKTLAINVCEHYLKHYNLDPGWTVVEVEMPFRIHLEGRINYIGTIDLLIKDADGKHWIVDHKTTSNLDIYDKNSDMDRQISRYWWSIERCMDIKIEGFIYNIILKDFPVSPKVLKSGQLSKDKSQKTTKEMYLDAIRLNKLNIDDYADFLQFLDEQPKEFFRRIKVERNISEMRAAIDELTDVIHDIRDKHRNGRWYRNITKDCSWDCPFKALCVAEMDGSNADHIRHELFTVKEDDE